MFNKVIIINNHSIMPSIIYEKHKRKNKGHITQCNFVTVLRFSRTLRSDKNAIYSDS